MLLSRSALDARMAVASGALAPLADSIAADLDRLLPDESAWVPPEKARLTRRGGRCERDGLLLEFDPRSPRRHRCPACDTWYEGEDHYRWWVMGYQLWLAERAVHAAVLSRLRPAGRHAGLARAILAALADRYLTYPNADNVLGPTRPFFSTYLESIWLLHVVVAQSLLELGAAPHPLDGRVREQIVEPSSRLVASFNEGDSNRQVWNSAALAASGLLLGDQAMVEEALDGPGGAGWHLSHGLLEDGTWYEGENYHLFAHRGLWYLVALAASAGFPLDLELVERFDRGFVAPLLTALPDFTVPARRDSQYGISLRQWRLAESLELGLARHPDAVELAAGLGVMYGDGPAGDPQRWRSTAEAERNVPGVRLTRADLGWKSLLFARPTLPALPEATPSGSVLLPDQGLAIVRRDRGLTWAALDYGASGGPHGHPDRLNLWLVLGDRPVFEDVGTGSYVDPSLHWYRSTLAHNAPLVDGLSQQRVDGILRAWDERTDLGWVDAEAEIAPGVRVRRALVVGDGYLVDRVEWDAARSVRLSLPMHVDAGIAGAVWRESPAGGGAGTEDGFARVEDAVAAAGQDVTRVTGRGIDGVVRCAQPSAWQRFRAPGPPGSPPRPFLLLSATGRRGTIESVWCWRGPVEVAWRDETLVMQSAAGPVVHRSAGGQWRVESAAGVTVLDGRRPAPERPQRPAPTPAPREPVVIVALPDDQAPAASSRQAGVLRRELGEADYRRTEASWREAGSPGATVVVAATRRELVVDVSVFGRALHGTTPLAENPLDNEHPDVNCDGVQIHLKLETAAGAAAATWLLVPEGTGAGDGERVRVSARDAAAGSRVHATWRPLDRGWRLVARIERAGLPGVPTAVDVLVNERPPARERRRGQLVLSGANGEWAYLRGDRQPLDRLIPIVIRDE